MNNNIFEYATSELSQDAFLCWCANWFNDPSNPKLQEMSIEMLKLFANVDEIKSVSVHRQFCKNVYIEDKKVPVKIDALIIVNGTVAVIIEDKTATSEHDDQIQRYRNGLKQIMSTSTMEEKHHSIQSIRSVFLKTGFFFDDDRCVEADLIVTGDELLKILSKYLGNSEILDSYVMKLKNDLQFNAELEHYEGSDESFWNWKVARHHVSQYRLMRDIFPETLWVDHESWIYRIYHGTSYGRPWTQMQIFETKYENSEDVFSVFWRIDTDKYGPYLSLRLYEKMDKKDTAQMDRHRMIYDTMSDAMRSILEENKFCAWRDVKPAKYKGNCRESEIIHIQLVDKLKECEDSRRNWMDGVRQISDEFLAKIKEIV